MHLRQIAVALASAVVAVVAVLWALRDSAFFSQRVDVEVDVHISRAYVLIYIVCSSLLSSAVVYFFWFRKAVGTYAFVPDCSVDITALFTNRHLLGSVS